MFVGVLLTGVLVAQPALAPAQRETAFRGRPVPQALQPSGSISCFADRAAATGYYRAVIPEPGKADVTLHSTPLGGGYRAVIPEPGKADVTLHSTPLESQTAGGGYKISFAGEEATVADEFMKDSYRFQVYQRREDGVILIRAKGVGVEVITIDPRSGSFVLTDSGVQTLWNRASVWAGRCE